MRFKSMFWKGLLCGLVALGRPDVTAAETELVTARPAGIESPAAGGGDSGNPIISADGRFVAYRSTANILPGITNTTQLYLYDRQTRTTTLIGASAFGLRPGNSRAQTPVFSSDSQTLAFLSWSTDLGFLDFNQNPDLFSWKIATTTNAVSAFAGQIVYAPASGKSPTLTWPVVPGKSYFVQFKNELIDPFWQTLPGSITIVGTNGLATDLAPNPAHRFYRIKAY